jgi:hypothetical protein
MREIRTAFWQCLVIALLLSSSCSGSNKNKPLSPSDIIKELNCISTGIEEAIAEANDNCQPFVILAFASWAKGPWNNVVAFIEDEAVARYREIIPVICVDFTEKNEEVMHLAGRYHVGSLPALVLFDAGGEQFGQTHSMRTGDELSSSIDNLISRSSAIKGTDGDRDGDGIKDEEDQCKCWPEDYDGLSDEDGCEEFDADGDDIRDEWDPCPSEYENHLNTKNFDGCPDDGENNVGTSDTDQEEISDKPAYKDNASDEQDDVPVECEKAANKMSVTKYCDFVSKTKLDCPISALCSEYLWLKAKKKEKKLKDKKYAKHCKKTEKQRQAMKDAPKTPLYDERNEFSKEISPQIEKCGLIGSGTLQFDVSGATGKVIGVSIKHWGETKKSKAIIHCVKKAAESFRFSPFKKCYHTITALSFVPNSQSE